jgi:hypothetical protein
LCADLGGAVHSKLHANGMVVVVVVVAVAVVVVRVGG